MSLALSWTDIAIRLSLTVVASALIGLDRESGGHNAGLRTTLLVGLAAAVAMIQANMLLPVDGKTSGAFSVLDLMRLPLGILTGVGFIGGGAILKRGNLVSGITTAGTLWITTVIGLCFGGGQLGLGGIATALTLATLVLLKRVDAAIPRNHQARAVLDKLSITSYSELTAILKDHGYQARFVRQENKQEVTELEISWRCKESSCRPERLVELLKRNSWLRSFEILNDGAGQ